ncbi:phage NrS-1 polymerase family protein [Paenibacillus sp. FSL K6-1230]|uniref:phage NrS-1 polymerase family protein n=1 Tax=Paenibacillus sp. FSL K6-1230 TaxID=2921603 RepID=UPI0030F8581B
MNIDKIPTELKERDQWVVWKLEQRKGSSKPTKVPYTVDGERASSTEPNNWASFEEALTVYEKSKSALSGIGYVFAESDPFTGIDIDNCIVDGKVQEDIIEIAKTLNSYTERSQSKKGLHIIVKGRIPGPRNRTGKFEMYEQGRFFVITGDHVAKTPEKIEQRQSELTWLYDLLFESKESIKQVVAESEVRLEDQVIIEAAKSARNGEKFKKLYSGSWSSYNSWSEAEQALCNMLAFYTKNAEQIDRLFRASGLMREKWEREDYRSRTITKALEGVKAQYKGNNDMSKTVRKSSNNRLSQFENVDESEYEFVFDTAAEWDGKLGEMALHGLAGDVVRLIDPHTEADPAALLINFLTMFGNMVGTGPHFVVSGGEHRMKLFSVLVGATFRGKKGTSLEPVLKLMNAVDVEFNSRKKSGLSSGEGVIFAVRDELIEQQAIYEGSGKQRKPTGEYEEVITDPGVKEKRLLIIESEFGSVLNVLRRDGNTLSAIIRNAWDGSGDIRTLTKNPMKATDTHISILGHITPEELRKLLTGNEIHNGFVNRFLWLYVQQSKSLPSGGEFHKVDVGPIVERIKNTLDYAINGMPKDNNGNFLPMERDSAAAELWGRIYEPIQKDANGVIGAATSRVIPYLMRIACIYALLDQSHLVRAEHLRAALAVWQYCYKSVVFIFGEQQVQDNPIITKIISRLKDCSEGLSLTDINDLFKGTVKSGELQTALKKMQENGLVSVRTIRGKGRPKRVIQLNVDAGEIA